MQTVRMRTRVAEIAALLISIALVLTLLPARQAAAATSSAGTSSTFTSSVESEQSFRTLMNAERVKRDRRRMKMIEQLSAVARQHSSEMAGTGGIFHNTNLAGDLTQVSWSIAGENVGVGYTVGSLHNMFMQSAPHRKNILRRSFNRVGVGVVAADNRIWVTVVFAG